MTINKNLIEEMNVLLQFNLESTQAGIKVHHDAADDVINATSRLFDKGMVTQKDGGYLTSLGHEVAEHAHCALEILKHK